jgi:hypothetical protein
MSWNYSQALAAAYLADCFADTALSARLNSIRTVDLFLYSGKTTDTSRLSRFGMTYEHLTDEDGEALLTWYREDSLARTSVRPATEPERIEFTSGLEAAALKDWHIDLLVNLQPKQMFFAYDTPSDLEALQYAGRKLNNAGFTLASRILRTYCLIGYKNDTFEQAENRLWQCIDAGFIPMAMLYRDGRTEPTVNWKRFARVWARPAIIVSKIKQKRAAQ